MKRAYSLISSSSSSSKSRIEYDVFLSFRGEDTRYTFTCHLYEALRKRGISTFLDDDKLERGKSISPELLKAIETSRCSVIVISENYAFSTWCLDELVKILVCMKKYKQIVLPIFYHVDPSHVRKQIGRIGEAFQKHEQHFSDNLEKVQSWRDALKEVANLAGSPLRDRDNEAKFIQDFIVYVLKGLGDKQSNISEDLVSFCKRSENLVGMASRLEKLDQYVRPSSSDGVRFIGICGMGGIGKTTLARAYYEWKSCEFESSSFLPNVREACEKEINGLANLKNRLLLELLGEEPTKMRDAYKEMGMMKNRLRYKKVLISLDDVDKEDQLEELVGEDDWLSSGSRVLVTTRNEGLLTFKNCTIYRAEQLNDSEGLQLFFRKAFKSSHPLDNFREPSKRATAYAKGLPLALKVLGSLLRGKTTNEWESAFLRLKEYPEEEIIKVLRITFDDLKETEKNIFLDIACFFNGYDKDYIIQIMDIRNFHGAIGIRTLIEKSLLSEGPFNEIRMHDLLEEMGKEIVREKSRSEPGRWSRIWDYNDLCHVLDKDTGTEEVEGIVCSFPEAKRSVWVAFSNMKKVFLEALSNGFSNMKKLRLLYVNFPASGLDLAPITYLSNELRILKWSGFPYPNLPSSFQPDGLVELILHYSNIRQLWNTSVKPLCNLKIIDLKGSKFLTKFEDFKVAPNLEKLILEDCHALVEVHRSITLLRSLTLLNLKNCRSLKNFAASISDFQSLKVLELSHCTILRNLQDGSEEVHGKMHTFGFFFGSFCSIGCTATRTGAGRGQKHGLLRRVFDLAPIAYLPKNLHTFEWSGLPLPILQSNCLPDELVELILHCSEIRQLSNSSIKPLYNLKIIDLSGSRNFREFEDFRVIPNLEKLILEDCKGLVEVHPSITLLKRLTLLNLNKCSSLENLPTTINGLESLEVLQLSHCKSLRNLPEDLGNLNSLKELHLCGTCVTELPSSIASLENLKIVFLLCKDLPFSGRLDSLKEVYLRWYSFEDGEIPEDFGCLTFLEVVDLSGNDFSYLPACFNRLTKLRILDLSWCENLKSLQSELPPSLEMVKVDGCISLDTFLDPLNDQCRNLRCSATCTNCFELVRRQGSKRTAFASLKRYLQNPLNPSKRFDIVLPGNEIPAWFTHQSSGTSISFQLDPNLCNSNWMGFAISVCPKKQSKSFMYDNITIDGQDWGFGQLIDSPESIRYCCIDHPLLWLCYLPRDIYFRTNELQYNNCSARVVFSFENNTEDQFGWGVRLVCEQDIHDLNLHSEDEDLDFRYMI